MSGISFVSNEKGTTTAVVIDVIKYRTVWEEFYNKLIAEKRIYEPGVKWKEAGRMLKRRKPK